MSAVQVLAGAASHFASWWWDFLSRHWGNGTSLMCQNSWVQAKWTQKKAFFFWRCVRFWQCLIWLTTDVFMRSVASHYGRLLLPVAPRPSVCGTRRNIHQMPNGQKQGPGHVFHPSGTLFRPTFSHSLDIIGDGLIRKEQVPIFCTC